MSSSLLFQMLLKMDAGQAKAELRTFVSEQQKASAAVEQSAGNMARAHQNAAGSVGNLVAQFNDIGMMIAAGQNPLQLAIQQGSQITQVIGPMGAAGAVRALGGALLGMLNPVNLVTFGIIAGGAALVQWAMSGEEAASAAERMADEVKLLGDAMTALRRADKASGADISTMVDQYGAMASKAREILEIERRRAQARANLAFKDSSEAVGAAFAGGAADFSSDQLVQQAAAYEELMAKQRQLEANYQALENGSRQFSAAELAAMQGHQAKLDVMTNGLSEYVSSIMNISEEFDVSEAAAQRLALAAAKVREADNTEARLAATEQLAQTVDEVTNGFTTGSLSAHELYEQLMIAVQAGLDFTALDLASGIGTAADEAGRLGKNLAESANAWLAARSIEQQPGNLAMAKYGGRGTVSSRPIEDGTGEVIRFKAASTSSGAGGAAAKEADSVAKLIEKLQAEADVSRELDPIQREMVQYRTQLAGATSAERDQVEALIAQRLREKSAMEALEFVGKQSGDALIDALMGGADAGARLVESLKRAALQALILGQGPLAGLFGGGLFGGFSLFSGPAAGALGLPFADGGMIYGAGGPRADQVPVMASAGEFIVNARATARHRPLLERINNGVVPGFARGGIIGGGAAGAQSGGTVFHAHFDLRGAQGDEAVRAAAKRGMDAALREFARSDLPGHMRRMTADPSVVRF